MKTITRLLFVAGMILLAAPAANAEWVRGYFRRDGTYVAPYYRTSANSTPYDNLSYRGYPTPRLMPILGTASYQPELRRSNSSYLGSPSISGSSVRIGDITFHDFSTPNGNEISGTSIAVGDIVFHDFSTSDGDLISGDTITIGDISFTTLDEF